MPLPSRSALLTALSRLGSGAVARGRDYHQQRRVTLQSLKEDGVDALVRGSAMYSVYVDFRHGQVVRSECNCPVGVGCKHIVATLLTVIDHLPADPQEAARRAAQEEARQLHIAQAWLQGFAPPEYGKAAPRQDEQLRYVLTAPLAHGLRVLRLEAQVQYRLKSGRWSTPKRPNIDRILSNYDVPDYVRPEDIVLFHLLRASAPRYYYQDPLREPLSEQLGLLIVQALLQTGRCTVGSSDGPPLAWGESRELQIEWQNGKKGIAPRLIVEKGCELIPFDRPVWINEATGECGELRSTMGSEQLRALLQAPELPPQQWLSLAGKLPKAWQKTGLRLPGVVSEHLLDGLVPVPLLHIARLPDGAGDGLLLEPAFAYADHRIPPYPQQALHELPDGRLLQRELAAEDAWLAEVPGTPAMLHRPLVERFAIGGAEQVITRPDDLPDLFQRIVPALRAAGWRIAVDRDAEITISDAEGWWAELDDEDGNDWFGVDLGVLVDGERLSLLPLLVEAIRKAPADYQLAKLAETDTLLLPAGEGRFLRLPTERLRPILQTLTELFDADFDADRPVRLPASHAARLTELGDWAWSGGERTRALAQKLADFAGITPQAAPAGFAATLRAYQQQGLGWLQFLREYGFNGILADDMGLGKTVQTLAHIATEKAAGRLDRPCLVVAPTSLMFNWQREAAAFAPALRVLLLHGNARHERFAQIAGHDLVLTTYPLLPRDAEVLQEQAWHLLILDEAQAIKNPKAQAAGIVRDLTVRHRLCLTGTPMENHLGELWALFDFLMPGFLGRDRQFNSLFRTPIEKQGDAERRQQLSRRVAPFLLRRTKEQVATELPPKTEIIRVAELQGAQRDLYETVRLALSEKVRQEVESKGFKRSQIVILDALLKLREVCCDPRLVNLAQAKKVKHSAKLDMLLALLPELLEEGRRILLFSQFTRMLGLIEDELKARQIAYVKLTGQTRDRATPVERFQNGEVPVFLISLKAGGVGLNLTAADTVIHYDPWWNPAVEDQATDRAYRIGQDKPVFVYKLVCAGSVEEKMQLMKDRKKALAAGVYGETGEKAALLQADDLSALFAPLD
ncbi:DEAD/DEAH box helicase [Chitinilyticum litopenaei]|uniref:DEAD/DEAH box helicase n=1 Tax=Chitinilyticum litopenaei TaxID=1121276 RepID=UPI000415A3EB|nr:DEAD/DEAH box helicase [Chitinilyticum litopenaei]